MTRLPYMVVGAVASVALASTALADGRADFDAFAEGSPSKVIDDGGIRFSDLDMRIPGSQPPYNFTIERAIGNLNGLPGFTAPNTLDFGGYSPGDGAAFGRCGEFRISTGLVEQDISVEVFDFFSGSANTITLEARLGGVFVDSVTVPLKGGFSINHYTLALNGIEFDEAWIIGSGPDNEGCFFGLVDHVVITGAGAETLTLDAPVPGTPGVVNQWIAHNAQPGVRVYFTYGFRSGVTNVPGCPGVVVDILKPTVLDSAIADAFGEAEVQTKVPGQAAGRTVFFQAVTTADCQVSNLVKHTF